METKKHLIINDIIELLKKYDENNLGDEEIEGEEYYEDNGEWMEYVKFKPSIPTVFSSELQNILLVNGKNLKEIFKDASIKIFGENLNGEHGLLLIEQLGEMDGNTYTIDGTVLCSGIPKIAKIGSESNPSVFIKGEVSQSPMSFITISNLFLIKDSPIHIKISITPTLR